MGLPDPEMRKFLVNGDADSVTRALSAHAAGGLGVAVEGEEVVLTAGENIHRLPLRQQLKLTVRAANALMEEIHT